MSVTSSTSRVQYNCNNSTVAFPFTFGVGSSSEIQVILTSSAGVETVLTETTHYSVAATNNRFSNGGTVTTVATYDTGNKITILRNVPVTQASDFTEGMPTLYETFENGLDKLTRISQQQQEQIARTPKLKKSSTLSGVEIDEGAGRYLRWNDAGTGITTEQNIVPDETTYVWTKADYPGGIDFTGIDTSKWPVRQLFSGFSAGDITGLTDPHAEWWGASPSATAATNFSAITCALAAITMTGTAWLGDGVFATSDTVIIDGRYKVYRTLRGRGKRNTYLFHTGAQATGAVIIKGGGYSDASPIYGNTGGNVRDIALGSLGGPALTLLNATRCFDTRDIYLFSANSTAEYLLISGDSGMNHIEDINDSGNDTVPAAVTALSPDYPLYGIRLEKGAGTYGPIENKIVRPRIEYTRDAALQVDLSYEENILESVKFGSGRISGPAINIVDGPIKLTGMNYLEKYGAGTVGVNLDNKTGTPSLTAENLEMAAQSIDLGTYGDTGTNLVSLDIRGSNFLNIRNSVKAYIDVFNIINCRTLTYPTWMPTSGSFNIYGNRYWNTGAGAYQLFRDQEAIVAGQVRVGATTKVTGIGSETTFTPGISKAVTFTFYGSAAIVLIINGVSGAAGYALVSYASATITFITGSDAQFVDSASPTANQIGMSKGANSSTVTVSTGSNISGAIGVTVIGQDITAVTDPS